MHATLATNVPFWPPGYCEGKDSVNFLARMMLWLINGVILGRTLEFFLNVFNRFSEFADKIFIITVKGLEPATALVRDQDATTAPARHL